MNSVLNATGVGKRFGRVVALRAVDIDLTEGETLLVKGPNGSGKSTLLRLLAGLTRPSAGSVEIEGRPPAAVRRSVGYLGHDPYLYPNLTAEENLSFYSKLYGLDESRGAAALSSVGLEKWNRPVGQLSKGDTQRAAIARCLLHDPRYLLLDEPLTGLDRSGSELVLELMRSFSGTLVVATHLDGGIKASQTLDLGTEAIS